LRASETEVLFPTSAAEAMQAFGDGRDVTVFAGGTILMPARAYGRFPSAHRTLMLDRAGLDELGGDGTVVVGAMTRLSTLADSDLEPLASAAAAVAALAIRAQAPIGGNLRAPPGRATPRGALPAPILAERIGIHQARAAQWAWGFAFSSMWRKTSRALVENSPPSVNSAYDQVSNHHPTLTRGMTHRVASAEGSPRLRAHAAKEVGPVDVMNPSRRHHAEPQDPNQVIP